jgi:hypothetical protein
MNSVLFPLRMPRRVCVSAQERAVHQRVAGLRWDADSYTGRWNRQRDFTGNQATKVATKMCGNPLTRPKLVATVDGASTRVSSFCLRD